jgi:hypothetical protein
MADWNVSTLLDQAIEKVKRLSPEEQELIAARLLADLAEDEEVDQDLTAERPLLTQMAREALRQYHAGETEELIPDQL